jgi:hypothetical protein
VFGESEAIPIWFVKLIGDSEAVPIWLQFDETKLTQSYHL